MSARKSVYRISDERCDGGESPNAFVPKVTAEVRVHYPPVFAGGENSNARLARANLDRVWAEARAELTKAIREGF